MTELEAMAGSYLQFLCSRRPDRRTGGAGNREATDFVAARLASSGFDTRCPPFACLDWWEEGAQLAVGDTHFSVEASPYSLGADLQASLVAAGSIAELENITAAGELLVLHGELAQEQLMPKNFPFYNPEHHQQIYRLVEEEAPAAVIAVTGRNSELAGAVYPFPVFSDGDFDIPSVFMTDQEGARLLAREGEPATLRIRAKRWMATAGNVIGRKGEPAGRIVVCAHIDTALGTPGAVDNAGGVTVLLLLAEMLSDYSGASGVEILALNGEDNYSAAGQIHYLATEPVSDAEVRLVINIDGAGYRSGRTVASFYNVPERQAAIVRQVLSGHTQLGEGEQWYQGDHMIFVQRGIPAIALTTDHAWEFMTQYGHSAADAPDLVDPAQLAAAAGAIRDVILALGGEAGPV
jgi:aminopeptidase YwaD